MQNPEPDPGGVRPPEPQSNPPEPPWVALSDSDLLKWRIADLKVTIQASNLRQRMDEVYGELAGKGMRFRPECYLATEWLTPDRIPLVGIAFYLAHPRLIRLEKAMMVEAEGESPSECMKLLRHETGHAVNYAYRLYRRTRWRDLFGPMTAEYDPHSYFMRPYSRQYVIHLSDHYAQAHPDEDFAETFAVWLTPGLDWRKRYAGWGALKKLEYIDYLMRTIAEQPPPVPGGPRVFAAAKSRSTLETYFNLKRREYGEGYLGFYDPALIKLFPPTPAGVRTETAHRFLGRNRKTLVDAIVEWAAVPRYSVHELLSRLAARARAMRLSVPADSADGMLFRVGVCLNSLLLGEQDRYDAAFRRRSPE